MADDTELTFHCQLAEHRKRPRPFDHFDTAQLWTNELISRRMLDLHLDDTSEPVVKSQEVFLVPSEPADGRLALDRYLIVQQFET